MSAPAAPFDAILFDMDGVLYNSSVAIDGAAEALNWVRAERIPHLFLTNTSSRTRSSLAEKLRGFGIPADDSEILTPAAAAADWLRANAPASSPIALFVPEKSRSEFAGLNCLPDNAETGARAVVIGDLGAAWDFQALNRAFRLLHSAPDCELIALGMTRYWQGPDGLRLDVAAFVSALEHAVQRPALIFGKPSATFFLAAAEKLGVPPSKVVMIGDDIFTDIAGAQRAGLKATLVLTGKFRPNDLEGDVVPYAVLDSIAALSTWWKSR